MGLRQARILFSDSLPCLALVCLSSVATNAVTDERRAFAVTDMPLTTFLEYALPSVDFNIELSLNDISVTGVYEGNAIEIINQLSEEYSFEASEDDSVYNLTSQSRNKASADIDISVFDAPIADFAEQLADLSNRDLHLDASLNYTIDGRYMGSLEDIANDLASEYSLLVYIDNSLISLVSEDTYVEQTYDLPIDHADSNDFSFLEKVPAQIGNFASIENNSITIGGHPNYVLTQVTQYQDILANLLSNSLDKLAAIPADVDTLLPGVPSAENPPNAEIPNAETTSVDIPTAENKQPVPVEERNNSAQPESVEPGPERRENDFFSPLEDLPGFY